MHPEDRPLLGMVWEGALFVDAALPFGLRSTPKIFTALADALEWLARQEGVESLMHYLGRLPAYTKDGGGVPGCPAQIAMPIWTAESASGARKLEGPGTTLRFLGIEINTKEMSLRLPAEKLAELRLLVANWLGRKCCTVRELESLVGKLQHASKVVRPGRTFLR